MRYLIAIMALAVVAHSATPDQQARKILINGEAAAIRARAILARIDVLDESILATRKAGQSTAGLQSHRRLMDQRLKSLEVVLKTRFQMLVKLAVADPGILVRYGKDRRRSTGWRDIDWGSWRPRQGRR